MNKMIFAALLTAASVSNATTIVPLKAAGVMPPCGSSPYVTEIVATSIDSNGTVKGQIEYVGSVNVGSGRGGTRTVLYSSVYNAVWAVDGTLVSSSLLKDNGCTAINPLTGVFAVPNNQSYLHTYTNGYYTVNSQYTTAGSPPRMQWVTNLSF